MDVFQFSNIFFPRFRFFRWKCDSYGIHLIMLFLELLITKKMSEKNWKNIENWQFYKKFTKSYICWKKFEHFESNSKYSLYIACFLCATKTLDSGVKYVIYLSHIPIFPIYLTNISHISLQNSEFLSHRENKPSFEISIQIRFE